MSLSRTSLVVLDTSVVIHLARNDATGQDIERRYALTSRRDRPVISSVTEGEVLGLAYYWNWGQKKVQNMQDILANLVRLDAGHPAVVDSYARLYAHARRMGHSCGENDLWIAATAQVAGAALLTCDADFDWLHPDYLTVLH